MVSSSVVVAVVAAILVSLITVVAVVSSSGGSSSRSSGSSTISGIMNSKVPAVSGQHVVPPVEAEAAARQVSCIQPVLRKY